MAAESSEKVKVSALSTSFEDDPLLLWLLLIVRELCRLLENDLMVVFVVEMVGKTSSPLGSVGVGCTELSTLGFNKRRVRTHKQYRIEQRPTKAPIDPTIRNANNSVLLLSLEDGVGEFGSDDGDRGGVSGIGTASGICVWHE